ncbi:centrosomal protein of 135 kDa-like [Gouania willdenowi]|uniref:centrosomal protein of 135 kDa-like n=1 Tax=Gouania willdenowi TaxID=441366 RepID=UPI001055ADD1|nr:centrosomal protein of 135 kDa-like [Gouania willdenowi]XP_028300535.1 centrosomal protein of 135 kDa-like [Gouania willdenowi]
MEKNRQNFDALLESYKADKARVVKENNELRLELLRLREMKDRVTRGGKTHRLQRMQIADLVPPSSTSAYPVQQPDDPYLADLPLRADGRIHELQDDIVKVKLDLENAQDFIKHLQSQVKEREKEIERLNPALQGGRPHDVISLEAQNISNEKLISHLNLQIEYLQETNRTLEQKVEALQQKKEDVSTEVANLSLKNLELCEELSHIDDLAKRIQMDKEHVLETADMELQDAKKEIQRQQKCIEDLEDIVTQLRQEQSEGQFDKDRLRDKLVELKGQNEKLEGLVNFLEDEKTRLQDKVEKMMVSDRELVLELEAMRIKHGVCGRERSPSRLDAFVKGLEEERDYYRREVELYRWTKESAGLEQSPIQSRGRSPQSKGGVVQTELLHLIRERDHLKAALMDFEKEMDNIESDVKALSSERDHFETLYKQAQDELKLGRGMDRSTEVLKLKKKLKRADVKLGQITADRDLLIEKLKVAQTSAHTGSDAEKQRNIDLENNIKSLEQERVAMQSQLCLIKEEAAQQRAESSALRSLQVQMEQSLADAQHRLSVKMNELHNADVQIEKLEQRLEELSQHSSKHNEGVAALQKSVSSLDKEKDALQDEVDQKTEKLVHVQEELSKKEKTLVDVRLTVQNMESSLVQLQGALNSREREISSLRRQLDVSQEEHAKFRREKDVAIRENRRLQDDLASMTRENQAVHGEMEEALHEKDELKMRVHAYISEVSRIERLMEAREQENQDLLERFKMNHTVIEEWEQKQSCCPQTLNADTSGTLSTRGREKSSSEQTVQEMHRQYLSTSSLQSSSSLSGSSRSHHVSTDCSILRNLDHSTESSA